MIFTPDARFSYENLAARARQTAFLIPGLRIAVRDERRLPGTPASLTPTKRSSSTMAVSLSSWTTLPMTRP